MIEPFRITKKVPNKTYKLNLKNLVGKIHDSFHVEKLEKYVKPQHGQFDYDTEWLVNDEETYKDLIDVIYSRFNNNKCEYRVFWSDKSTEWIPHDQLDKDSLQINTFHNINPEKPIPLERQVERSARTRRPPTRYIDK